MSGSPIMSGSPFFTSAPALARGWSRLTDRDSSSMTGTSHLSDRPRSTSLLTEPLSEEQEHELLDQGSNTALQQSGVGLTAANIAAEVMGAGVLSLPHACASLGWIVGVGSTIVFGACSIHAGLLLARTKTRLFPQAESYADLAVLTVGRRFGLFTRVAVLAQWALLLPFFALALVSSLRLALPHLQLCFLQWALLAAAVLIAPLQLQTLHAISYASTLSNAAMGAATVLILVAMCLSPASSGDRGGGGAAPASPPPGNHSLWPPALAGGGRVDVAVLIELGGSVCAFVFAYQGQSLYLELMREMRAPQRFGRAVALSNCGMCAVYAATVAVGYGARGSSVAGFLPDALPPGAARVAVGALLAFHVAVSFLVTGQPLHRAVHAACFPRDAARRVRSHARPASPLAWLAVTSSVLLLALFVAALVPFFAEFQKLLGALTGAPTLFGWPALFYVRGAQLRQVRVSRVECALCAAYVGLITPALATMGTLSAIAGIAARWGSEGSPLSSCHL